MIVRHFTTNIYFKVFGIGPSKYDNISTSYSQEFQNLVKIFATFAKKYDSKRLNDKSLEWSLSKLVENFT